MKILILLIVIACQQASAQWEPMDVTRTGSVNQIGFADDNVQYATSTYHLFRKGDVGEWKLVNEVWDGPASRMRDLNAWGASIATLTYRVYGTPSESIAWVSANNGQTWKAIRLGLSTYRLLPRSMKAVALVRFNDSTQAIEVVDFSKENIERDTFAIDHVFTQEFLLVSEHEIQIYDYWPYSQPGQSYTVRVFDVMRPMSEWETHVIPVNESAFEIPNAGIGMWNSDALSEEPDTLTVFRGIRVDVIPCLEPLGVFARNGIVYGDGAYFCIVSVGHIVLHTSTGEDGWHVVDTLPSTPPGKALAFNANEVYLNRQTGAFFSYNTLDKQVSAQNAGLPTNSYRLLVDNDVVVATNCNTNDVSGIAIWRDAVPSPVINYVDYEYSHVQNLKTTAGGLWDLGLAASRLDLTTLSLSTEGVAIGDITTFKGREFILRRDTVFKKNFTTHQYEVFIHDENHMTDCLALSSTEDALIVFRGYAHDIDAIDIGALRYDPVGQYIGGASVMSNMTSYSLRDIEAISCGNEAAFMAEGRTFVSWENGSKWSDSEWESATDRGVWRWDGANNIIRHASGVDKPKVAIHTPPLPNVVVRSVFCLTNNCYAETDVGVYRIPVTHVSVAHEVQPRELTDESLSIFYVNGSLSIKYAGELTVSDLNGNVVYRESVNDNSMNVVRGLVSGAYCCVLNSNGRLFATLILHIDQ